MELDALLELQAGVVSRRQLLLGCGLRDHDIRRMVRRRELVAIHSGVYLNHTGAATWLQRAWAGVLALAPVALSHDSALRALDGPGRHDDGPIHVAVDRRRTVQAPDGVMRHYLSDLEQRTQWNASPLRVRTEHVVLDIAAAATTDFAAIAAIATAVQARRTTAARIEAALACRERVARREFLTAVVADVAAGACSVLEHGYLHRVERAHGLPRAGRQVTASSRGPILRDVEYRRQDLVVELDGRFFHDNPRSRDRDLDRDLDAAVDHRVTTRLGWAQVVDRPCETAHRMATLLQQRGWRGVLMPCPQCL